MKHKSIPDPPGFGQLSKSEQLLYLQTLWNRISEHPDEIPALESHLQLAQRRLEDYRRNPESSQPAYEAIDRLSKKSQ